MRGHVASVLPRGSAAPPAPGGADLDRLAAGCAAAMLAGAAASWARFAWEGTLRIDTGTPAYLVAALLLGVALAAASACALRLERLDGPVTDRHVRWAVAVQLCAGPALALTSLDLFANLAYGALQLAGENPHLVGPRALGGGELLALVPRRWADAPSAYGPILSQVTRLAAAVGAAASSPVWMAGLAFKAAMLACAVAALAVAAATLRVARAPDAAGRFALFGFAPLLGWEIGGQAHNDGLVLLALAIVVWAGTRRAASEAGPGGARAAAGYDALAVAAAAIATASKIPAAPVLVLYLAFVARASPLRAAGLAALALAIGALAIAPYWHGLATFGGGRLAVAGGVDRHAHSLADLLCLLLDPVAPRVSAAAYWASWIASSALCAALLLRGVVRATSVASVLHDATLVFLAWYVTSPWWQPWYAVWVLPLAIVEQDRELRRIIAVYAALTVVQWALPLDPFSTVAVDAWLVLRVWRNERRRAQGRSQEACRRTGAVPVI